MSVARENWIDAAKGAAILLVVIGHAWRGVNGRGLIPADLFAAVDTRIYAFHMPVFFAASGLFFARSLARMPVKAFVSSRLSRMFWPMVLWTYLFLAFKVAAGGRANTPVSVEDMLVWPIPGYLHLWFLWALFLLHMAFLLTRPLLTSTGRYPTLVLLFLTCLAVGASLLHLPREVTYWVGNAFRFAPFFVLGLWLGQSTLLSNTKAPVQIPAMVAFAVILVLWPPADPVTSLMSSLALTLAYLLVFSGCAKWFQTHGKWLITLGSASMAIYLAHTIFSAGLREVLLAKGVRDLTTHIVLGTLIGIIAPLVMLWIARKLKAERLLGF